MLSSVLAFISARLPHSHPSAHRARWLVLLACILLGASLPAQAAGWSAAASMATARFYPASTLLPSGNVLVAGGFNGAITNTCTVNVNSGLVNAVAAGTCVIAANQGGNANCNPAP